MIKLKSSAILIALVLGGILTALVTLIAIDSHLELAKSSSARNLSVAKSAALSGIEVGISDYLESFEQGKIDSIFSNEPREGELELKSDRSTYQVRAKMEALSYGDDFSKSDWLEDANRAKEQNALNLDESKNLNIDLRYLSRAETKITRIEVKFSDLFTTVDGEIRKVIGGSGARVFYNLTENHSGKFVSKGEFEVNGENQFEINSLDKCLAAKESCTLEIGLNSFAGNLVFMKINGSSFASDLKPTGDRPGTLVIEAVGDFRGTKQVVQAKFSHLGGKFLGIFYPQADTIK